MNQTGVCCLRAWSLLTLATKGGSSTPPSRLFLSPAPASTSYQLESVSNGWERRDPRPLHLVVHHRARVAAGIETLEPFFRTSPPSPAGSPQPAQGGCKGKGFGLCVHAAAPARQQHTVMLGCCGDKEPRAIPVQPLCPGSSTFWGWGSCKERDLFPPAKWEGLGSGAVTDSGQ